MRGAIGALLPCIDLHHARYIQRVDAREGIRRNQDNARVCVDLLLRISQLDGLEHCAPYQQCSPQQQAVRVLPAGSFRCDRFVRSSLASSMAGFISGGRLASLPSRMAVSVVSKSFFCVQRQRRVCGVHTCCSLLYTESPITILQKRTYLAVLQLEHQLHFVALNDLVDHLGGHPALLLVGLPCPRAHVENVCHRLELSHCPHSSGWGRGSVGLYTPNVREAVKKRECASNSSGMLWRCVLRGSVRQPWRCCVTENSGTSRGKAAAL